MAKSRVSSYKTVADKKFVEDWNVKIQTLNQSFYKKLSLETSLGETVVWAFNYEQSDLEPVVILPGARTCGMFWDLNDNLQPLKKNFRIYLVDVVGQPGLSSGNSPDIKTDSYGWWVNEVLNGLSLKKTNIVGASFGGLLAIKLANVAPEKISKMILLNPAGLTNVSFSPFVMTYSLLPIFFPKRGNVERFLKKVVFAQKEIPAKERYDLLAEFIFHTCQNFKFAADLPIKLPVNEINNWDIPVYLILGENDALIPHQNTIKTAQKHIKNLNGIYTLKGVGHGIETSRKALEIVAGILSENNKTGET